MKMKRFRRVSVFSVDFSVFSVSAGFTLIELLVVVAIIGILSALLLSNFIGVRQRARDAQRKSDLRQIQSALELYRADVGSYPGISGSNYYLGSACPTPGSIKNVNTTYMQTIPCDPMKTTNYWNLGNYFYLPGNNNTTYTLGACLENLNDSDPNNTSTSPGNTTGGIQCGSANAKLFYVLTNP